MEKTRRFAPVLLLLSAACTQGGQPTDPPTEAVREAAGISDHWVGTWAVSPQGDGSAFSDQTLRQIVHTSIGGSSVRIRLSNVFGSQALAVDSVHIAERASGSSISAGTDHALTFAGQASVSIPAGQVVTSDAVPFDVKELSDLAVSFHLQAATGGTTAHGTGLQDNYVTSGNHASEQTLTGTQTKGSYYFLTNVDVQNTAAWGAVVTLGASITDGVASSSNNNRRWPNDLAKRLADAKLPVGVLNQGISGNRLLADGSGDSALKRFDRDALSQSGVRWIIFSDDPINDLGGANRPTGDQLIAGLKQLVAKAHAANVEFWCSTLTPFEGSGGWSQPGETARAAVIAFIKSADGGCDAIVDQDTATHDPTKPTWYLPTFDAGDHLHPNEKGLQAIADAVDLKGFAPPEGMGGAASGGNAGAAGVAGTVGGGAGGSGGVSGGGASGAGGSQAGHDAGGAGASGGPTTSGAGGLPSTNGGSGSTPVSVAGGGATSQAGTAPIAASAPADSSGCGCRVSSPSPGGLPWSLAALIFAGFARRRRWRQTFQA